MNEKTEKNLTIPFIEKIKDEANKTIEGEVKGFGWNKKQWGVSLGQVKHIIDAYNRLKKEAK